MRDNWGSKLKLKNKILMVDNNKINIQGNQAHIHKQMSNRITNLKRKKD